MLELQQRFQRTIVFVSHDLDEAFRIGNRIALMEGGRIVQVGTAREIIANPVDAYVEDFVAHMNPLGVLTAEDMAEPGDVPAEAAGAPIDRDTPIREVMRMMTETGAEVLPLAGGGRVTRQGIMLRLVAPGARKGGAVED